MGKILAYFTKSAILWIGCNIYTCKSVAKEAYEKWGGGGGVAKLNVAVLLTCDTSRSDTILKKSRKCRVKI